MEVVELMEQRASELSDWSVGLCVNTARRLCLFYSLAVSPVQTLPIIAGTVCLRALFMDVNAEVLYDYSSSALPPLPFPFVLLPFFFSPFPPFPPFPCPFLPF